MDFKTTALKRINQILKSDKGFTIIPVCPKCDTKFFMDEQHYGANYVARSAVMWHPRQRVEVPVSIVLAAKRYRGDEVVATVPDTALVLGASRSVDLLEDIFGKANVYRITESSRDWITRSIDMVLLQNATMQCRQCRMYEKEKEKERIKELRKKKHS